MSDRDYVIRVEGQSASDVKTFEVAGAAKMSSSRRTSTSSQHSLPSCTSPNYDSGNFSCSNNSEIYNQPIGDSSAEDEGSDYLPEFNLSELTDDVKQLQKELREKDQMLMLALADARKMKSELERLVKSERWYKNELRNQKRSRLDILEKLYLNERRFVEENQKLKADCANLYSVCSDVERKALTEKDALIKQLQELQRLFESTKIADGNSSSQSVLDHLKFELQKQRDAVLEKENLIDVLKKQKQSLLRDLDNFSTQRDSKILNLEANAFTLEQENRKITKKCVTLVEEKRHLEEEIRKYEKLLEDTKCSLQQCELDVSQLREKQQEQLKELKGRTDEIQVLRTLVSDLENQILKEDSLKTETRRLLENYREEIAKKTEEIEELKSSRRLDNDRMSKLQVEILSLENLRDSYECTKREVEQLRFQLQSKEFEMKNMTDIQVSQSNQLAGLQEQLLEYQRLRDNFDKYVNLLQSNNEILETREEEIEQLKLTNDDLVKDLAELKSAVNEREKHLQEKEDILTSNQNVIEELQTKLQEQSQMIEELNSQVRDNTRIQEDLVCCQDLLQQANESLAEKEKEISNLKESSSRQNRKLHELDTVSQENLKLSKDIVNLQKELEQVSEEFKQLKHVNANQATEIQSLYECRSKVEHLQDIIKDKISEIRRQDMEIDTLRLVIKGQKAQIRRFNCKCAENEELRKKFEDASNLLRIDKNIFETEIAELDYLRKIAERQALEIYKLTEQKDFRAPVHNSISAGSSDSALNEKLIEWEKSLHNEEYHGTHDLEVKARRIESMKALLDKKSDKILQLSSETEHWMELLNDLKSSKSTTGQSSLERTSEGSFANNENSKQIKETPKKVTQVELDKSDQESRAQLVQVSGDFSKMTEECRQTGNTPKEVTESNSIVFQPLILQNQFDEQYHHQVIIHPPKDVEGVTSNSERIQREDTLRKTSMKVPETCDVDWKILQRVLESEHRKKIARYEVHMHTLLDNIRSYKKKVRAMENRCVQLQNTYTALQEQLKESETEKEMMKNSYENEIEHLMTAKIKEIRKGDRNAQQEVFNAQQLQDVSRKYEKSQRVIAVLKQQLETARKQFLEMEDYKRLSVEFKLNLNTFVDDYTTLLSPLDSYKNSIATDEIYDLIAKSNNFVPNFDNLSNSIDALKGDMKKFSTAAAVGLNPIRKMSLMDELKAADPSRFS